MALTNDYPSIRPSLLLDFARSRALDPRITFTRATIATRVNEEGYVETVGSGVPRFDFDPTTLASKGLLIEEQRTNLLTYSEDFGNAAWNKSDSSVTTDATTAPNNTVTADKIVEAATNTPHYVYQSYSASTITITASAFFKADTRNIAVISFNPNANFNNLGAAVFFLLSTGVVGTQSNGTGTITSYGNGWYRCTATATVTSAGTINARFGCAIVDGVQTYTGDGTSGLFIWGAQLEAGAFPTSYIPTTTASVQRNADNASMTGTNFTSWFNNGEGTVYSGYTSNSTAYNGGVVALSDGTQSNRMIIRGMTTANTSVTIGVVGGVTQWNNGFASQTEAATKWVFAYKVNDIAFTRNAATVLPDTDALIPVVNQLKIGSDGDGTNILNGTISKIAYYPVRLTNAQLQALTRS